MGILKKFIEDYRQKRDKERELEEDVSIQKRVIEKQKSADERELEGYMEEMRRARISKQLEGFRKKKTNDIWHTNNFTNNKNLFKNKPMFKCRKVK
jgi:hypothetical protein